MNICLNMIVKDEAPIIEDCLRNVCDKLNITDWVICDTGSSDGTQEIIKKFFEKEGINGTLYEDEWKSFSHNRTLAVQRAKGRADYIIFFDADDRIEGEVPIPENPNKDTYYFELKGSNITWDRIFLVRSDFDWQWVGVLHEVIAREKPGMPYTSDYIKGGYNVIPGHFGNRSQVPSHIKYGKDAEILENAYYELEAEDEDIWNLLPRYAFYCGQSFRNTGNWEKTIYWYKKRTTMGGWREEVMMSYVEAGNAYLKNGQDEMAIATWMQGYDYDNSRAECLYQIAQYYYDNGKNISAHIYAMAAKNVKYPKNDKLFVQHHVYYHKIDYILSITTWYYNSFYGIVQNDKEIISIFKNLYKHRHHYNIANIISNLKCYFNKTDVELMEMMGAEVYLHNDTSKILAVNEI